MNEIWTAIVGNVATRPKTGATPTGHPLTSFRLASTIRRYDRGQWVDASTSFVTVVCWRSTAEHVASSVGIGDPVVVYGKLRVKEWADDEGHPRTTTEIEAVSLGHDLSRGTSAFVRRERKTDDAQDVDASVEALTRQVADDPLADGASLVA